MRKSYAICAVLLGAVVSSPRDAAATAYIHLYSADACSANPTGSITLEDLIVSSGYYYNNSASYSGWIECGPETGPYPTWTINDMTDVLVKGYDGNDGAGWGFYAALYARNGTSTAWEECDAQEDGDAASATGPITLTLDNGGCYNNYPDAITVAVNLPPSDVSTSKFYIFELEEAH